MEKILSRNSVEEMLFRNSSVYARHLIGLIGHLFFLARQKELAPYKISSPQAYMLFILYNLGHKTTLAELAEHTHRGISALSIQLTRMEKDGLVKKARETAKSVQLKFELTEKGIDTYHNTYKLKSDKAIMSVLSEEERQQLISMLIKIKNKAEKVAILRKPPVSQPVGNIYELIKSK